MQIDAHTGPLPSKPGETIGDSDPRWLVWLKRLVAGGHKAGNPRAVRPTEPARPYPPPPMPKVPNAD